MTTNVYALPAIRIASTEKVVLIEVPQSISRSNRLALVAGYLSTLTTVPATQLKTVETVLNLFQLAIPEFAGMDKVFTSVQVEVLKPTVIQLEQWMDNAPGDMQVDGIALPALLAESKPEAASVDSEVGVFAGVASVLFSLGRQANESSSAALLTKRPDALIRRFEISEDQQLLLPGKLAGPSRAFLETSFQAFSNYTEARAGIVRFFLAVKGSRAYLPLYLEVVMTNFQLMRGAGMTHVEAVLRLVQMHPWVLKVPALEPYLHHFAADLAKFETIPEGSRPYHRLLVPQSEYLFLSSELKPLIAVAGSFIEEIETTFSGYVYNKDQYSGLIAKVKAYVPHYTPSTGASSLAVLLGVRDEPLPKGEAAVLDSGKETV